MEDFPYLWKLKNRQNEAVLNGLPGMPKSPHELFENLKDSGVAASTPYGLLPTGDQAPQPLRKCPEYFVRMLACLEMPNLRPLQDLPIPGDHTGLIDKVVQQPGVFGPFQYSSSQPQQKDNDFDCYIVDAAEQTMQEIPTASSMKLLPMLSLSTDGWLHAMLAQINSSEHYALMVQYAPQQVPPELANGASRPTQEGATIQRPCSKAIALISSTMRSHVFQAGATGHKLVTENVVDLLHTDSAITRTADGAQRKYQIITYCTLDNVTDFKLDLPKHAKV